MLQVIAVIKIVYTFAEPKHTTMKATKQLFKINADGNLVTYNDKLNRWELTSRSWTWDDITPGYKRDSKRNYKANQ